MGVTPSTPPLSTVEVGTERLRVRGSGAGSVMTLGDEREALAHDRICYWSTELYGQRWMGCEAFVWEGASFEVPYVSHYVVCVTWYVRMWFVVCGMWYVICDMWQAWVWEICGCGGRVAVPD